MAKNVTKEGVYYLVFMYEIMTAKKYDNDLWLNDSNLVVEERDPRLDYFGTILLSEGERDYDAWFAINQNKTTETNASSETNSSNRGLRIKNPVLSASAASGVSLTT